MRRIVMVREVGRSGPPYRGSFDGYRFVDPEQFAESIFTEVTRRRGVVVSDGPGVAAVWLVDVVLDERRVFARGSGTMTPITSTRCPTWPCRAEPCSA
jgi:hypothetical protein